MKFLLILSFVTLSVSAGFLVRRDVQTIQTVIQGIGTKLTKLDASIKAFDGKDFNTLATDALGLSDMLKQGTQKIQASQPITINEALTLQQTLAPIQDQGNTLVADIVAKKPTFEAAGLCDVIGSQTKDFGATAQALVDATVSKLPAAIQGIAQGQVGTFTASFDQTAAAFAPGNCTNAVAAQATGSNATASALSKM
ncbi:hydrophobic surface binding protein A-domain-containing protein [Pseudomassariella vexata]|uniref:Hydrophobic surface binding protein A-domain-containing protein n=1 Tax=Pseudomassariella vexata TaxID=1141098 RepID=A0A1Y2D984_9PEZI|nr:hydrophobic surface binding protein A-domain-containing protein [Pseudomassariella vexata]ORY55830.1 hydrophobic surface binding protein A-domain-containing protein [Pseudomassariella vexata]